MIKTPLSTVIGGAFWTPSATILGSASKTLNQIIKSLFANNEQGFAYDPNDLSAMFQDAAGAVPVTGVGQPVSVHVDKSKGAAVGPELWNDANVVFSGGSSRLGPNRYHIKTLDGTYSAVSGVISGGIENVWVVVEFTIESLSSGYVSSEFTGQIATQKLGVHRWVTRSGSSLPTFKRSGVTDAIISNISVKRLLGNHAYQGTSASRPLLQSSPNRIEYDAIDDKLITTLPAQLTGCTVVRAVPNVGTQILTNQTIPATFEDSTDHCGLIVINRALTASETSQITKLFNKAAGV